MPLKTDRNSTRSNRLAQQIQRRTAELVRELRHAKAKFITITDTEVTRDYSHAKIFYTVLGTEEETNEVSVLLEQAKGFLSSELAKGISLYRMPKLHFIYDHSVAHGVALTQLINEAAKLPKAQE